jgi:uncharacterized protein (TIGR02145 family)
MKNSILRLLAISWRLRRHFIALCATSLITNYFSQKTSAQAPQGIPYQAIARNASGVAIENTAVKVRFSIRDSIATGAIKYQETHNPTTSALGLFSVNVGMGTVVSGTFSGINWGKNAKFLQVELDPAGGSSYTDLGTTQMMSVPYALYAAELPLRISNSGDTLFIGNQKIQISGLSSTRNNGPEITDIDGNVYQSIKIGNQTWMKENLRVSRYRNGDMIITGLGNANWSSSTMGAWSNYNDSPAFDVVYGKLYNWYAVSDQRNLCPLGWHIPSSAEYSILFDNLGGSTAAGGKMKLNSSIWQSPNVGVSNSSGFSWIPGGSRTNGNFMELGIISGAWSSTPTFSNLDAFVYTATNQSITIGTNSASKNSGWPVRCLKD